MLNFDELFEELAEIFSFFFWGDKFNLIYLKRSPVGKRALHLSVVQL